MSYIAARSETSTSILYKGDQDGKEKSGVLTLKAAESGSAAHPEFLPTWDPTQNYEPLKPFEFVDRGSFADKDLPNLFPKDAEIKFSDLTPKFGTEVRGVQLSTLSPEAKDELALYVAQRGIVVFREQDFKELGPAKAKEYAAHFGPLHIHPSSGAPEGHPEIHIVYRREGDPFKETFFKRFTTSTAWHSDVSYELQPPGITFFGLLEGPPTGGDTIFADTTEAYERLSPRFQEMLSGLTAVNSGFEQAHISKQQGGITRREPISSIHPIIRIHPVTKRKSIYVNPEFTRSIPGLKEEESESLLNFLFNHINNSPDFQARPRWEPGTVIVWDNRRAVHSAIQDWETDNRRHAFRLSPQGEQPTETL